MSFVAVENAEARFASATRVELDAEIPILVDQFGKPIKPKTNYNEKINSSSSNFYNDFLVILASLCRE